MPKVSVLMPVYNAEQYLAEAIDSIINQTFTDWEFIIINDGSTDNSKNIILQYQDSRIRYIENETNLKLIKTLNKGIHLCQGEYIARMDADDIAMPKRLEKQVDFLENNPLHIMCGTNAIVINNEGQPTGKMSNFSDDNYLQINLLFSDPFIHPSMLIRREAFSNARYNEDYVHVEDYELWCQLAKKGKLANINENLLKYRWHDTNVSVVNKAHQNKLKDEIIKYNLQSLNIVPTEEELYCHKITFQLYALGQKQNVSINLFNAIESWFCKLVDQNKQLKIYDQKDFIAFLWCRWLVLCLSQKKYLKTISPRFASYNPTVLKKVVKLSYQLNKKR